MANISRIGPRDPVELQRALRRVDEATAGISIPRAPRRLARTRAEVLYAAAGHQPEAIPLAQLSYAGELLMLVAVDLAAEPAQARRLIARLQAVAGVPSLALARDVLQGGRLLGLSARVAIEVHLAFLRAFSEAGSVTLWTLTDQGLTQVAQAGRPGDANDSVRAVAQHLLADDAYSPPTGAALSAARVERLRPPPGALVIEGSALTPDEDELLLAAAGPALSALLDRDTPAVREPPAADPLLSSAQRRLARLRFDLHDGPQQDVHLLAQDLALFREQLRPMLTDEPNAERLLGRLDDLEAQLVALDGDLRRLSSAVRSPLLASGTVPDEVRSITDAFAARTGVVPKVGFNGDLDELTESQQIALLSLIREALSNIRKHSEAGQVEIMIAAGDEVLQVEIRDDGKGFEPEDTLVAAARAGRLGLVGMHERVRMLGGVTRIDSRPGGGTAISATLPARAVDDAPSPQPLQDGSDRS